MIRSPKLETLALTFQPYVPQLQRFLDCNRQLKKVEIGHIGAFNDGTIVESLEHRMIEKFALADVSGIGKKKIETASTWSFVSSNRVGFQ